MRPSLVTVTLLFALAAFPVNGQTTEGVVGDAIPGAMWQQTSPEPVGHSSAQLEDLGAWVKRDGTPAPGQVSDDTLRDSKSADFNRDIYYRNKLEFSLEGGWLPFNVWTWPLHYTLVPTIASLRWQLSGVRGPKFLRGNTDFTFGGSYTAIPRGAETRYFAFIYGIRRNFVQPRWRIVPYFEMRGGIGDINAKGPDGVLYAQGQDLTFTFITGGGARYNFNPRYSIAAGLTYMHISNAYLSQPRYTDYGINVMGPIFGINVRLGKQKRLSAR